MHAPSNAHVNLVDSLHRFELERSTPASARLIADGQDTEQLLEGLDLLAAYEWQGLFLLLVHTGNHFEDALHCYLLDTNFSVLDHASMGGYYSSGDMGALRVCQPDTIEFTFPTSQQAWQLKLLPQKCLRIPGIHDPLGVRRQRTFTRHFALRRLAQRGPVAPVVG